MDIAIKFAILGASLSVFLSFCFEYGNIFSAYYRAITAYLRYGLIKKNKYFIRPSYIPKYKIWLFKILGGCIFCNNVYLVTGIYIIAFLANLTLTHFLLDWLLSVTLSHVFLQIYFKYINN